MANTSNKQPRNPVKAWLAEFLLSRDNIGGPSGRPLYSYQVTSQEFEQLRELLKTCRDHAAQPLYREQWRAAFCLFAAECYRRLYGSDDIDWDWSWSWFEGPIGCEFSLQERPQIVEHGLSYWSRPVRNREGRRDLLGSLCLEGGLPWQLVQSETHGFGRVVRRGLKYFYRTEGGRRTASDLIAEAEDELPLTFRNLDTRQLLAGIVEQLMLLGRTHPLKDQADPAAYLDKHADGWRSDFPIPLDEANARSLVNDWLRDAGKRNQERREALEREQGYTCAHRLMGEVGTWRIRAELTLPSEETIHVDRRMLGGTRLLLAVFEGERLALQVGAVYAQLSEDGLRVRFPTKQLSVERERLDEPLSVRLLESGRPVHAFVFDDSSLDVNVVPLVFELRDEQRYLAATASCALATASVWVRLPPRSHVEIGSPTVLGQDSRGGVWVEGTEDLCVRSGEELYQIELNRDRTVGAAVSVEGHFSLLESTPSSLFLGWPKLKVAEGATYQADSLSVFANGKRVVGAPSKKRAGVIRYNVRDQAGRTVLQRRFGVLPEGFGVSLYPAFKEQPARLLLRNAKGLEIRVLGENVSSQQAEDDTGVTIRLRSGSSVPPARFALELSSVGETEPVTLHFNYPQVGARLLASDESQASTDELVLDELLGRRIVLSSSAAAGEDFYVGLELVGRSNLRLRRSYVVRIYDVPVTLSLYSFQNDIRQMLGAVDEQDAYIRLTVETNQQLLRLNVRRFNGMLRRDTESRVFLADMNGTRSFALGAGVHAMLLSDPKQAPIELHEHTTEGVGTGCFDIPASMERSGPWLIYPSQGSAVKFRPILHVSGGLAGEEIGNAGSLHRATQLYHPQSNPTVIDEQIALMGDDFDHSGWQYLDDLRRHYSHLPLSTFESWLSLSRNKRALAVAVLRMQVDESFCHRIRDELAVIWECIPIATWVGAFADLRRWLIGNGLPDAAVQRVLDNRKLVLKVAVPGFEHLADYLSTGDSPGKRPPIDFVLPRDYQTLRRNHEADDRWPTDLGQELTAWIRKQPLPQAIRQLSNVAYSDAVTYLPIFMAHVTAGKATLSDIPGGEVQIRFAIRKLSDFDRQGWYLYAHSLVLWYAISA